MNVNLHRKKNGLENLVLVSQLGINVMTPVFLCLIAGDWLDHKFGTSLTVLFLLLGISAGGLSAYKMARSTIEKERKAEEREKKQKIREWEERYGTSDGTGKNKRKGW